MSGSGRSLAPQLALLREQRYQRRFLREDARQTGILMAAVAVADVAIARNDFVLLRGGLLGVALACRVVMLLALLGSILLLRRAKRPRQLARALYLGPVTVAVGSAVLCLTRVPSGQVLGGLVAGGALIALVYFALRGPIVPRAIAGSLLAGGSLAPVFFSSAQAVLGGPARVTTAVSFVVLNLVGIFSAHSFEQQRRKRFEAERGERRARRELTAKLRELAAEKERAEGLSRARAAFLAAMSHEFRTPMNAVIGLSDLLAEAPHGPEHRGYARTIRDSARALLGQLNDILDFAKIDAQKLSFSPVPFDIRGLATSVVDMLHPQATARSIRLTLDISPGVPRHLLGDDARLRQVLVNLVSNAIKFTERGAVALRIGARAVEEGEHEIAVRVEDSGIGMAPDVLARLFRPFEQGDNGIARRHEGTGLGLAISKQIVLAMGGDIHVESEPGRGSVFSFAVRLPVAECPPETAVLVRREDARPLAILVVDDQPINREVARVSFERLGYGVDLAKGGQEALEAVTRKDYDVVFMDLRMPGMSGIEATSRIEEALVGKRAPHIVAMTASVFEEDREACRRAGMRDFLGKPIDLAQLDALLVRVAEERGASVRPLREEPLARLRQIESLGEPGFFENICHVFLTDTRLRLPRMKDALAREDAPAIEREAHILTSASATVGALALSELSADVEGAAREGRIQDIGARLDAMSAQLVEVERALSREIGRGHLSAAAEGTS